MQKNKITQKLVTYADHNKLWDDTKEIEDKAVDLQNQIDNLPTGGGMTVADMGLGVPIAFMYNAGSTGVGPTAAMSLIYTR